MTDYLMKKILDEAISELKAARGYIDIAYLMENEADALRFIEIAKDELRHFDFDNHMFAENIKSSTNLYNDMVATMHKYYLDWSEELKDCVNKFHFHK